MNWQFRIIQERLDLKLTFPSRENQVEMWTDTWIEPLLTLTNAYNLQCNTEAWRCRNSAKYFKVNTRTFDLDVSANFKPNFSLGGPLACAGATEFIPDLEMSQS